MSPDQAIADDVRLHGRSIIRINDAAPPFAYTVGLMFTFQHPELIICGLREDGPDILRGMAKLMLGARRFDSPEEFEIAPTLKLATRPVHPTRHEFYLGFAMGYCREQGRPGGLQARQVFWPDKAGRYPFQRRCDERVWAAQPRLDQPLGPLELSELRAHRAR